jgi:hypothetical protein
MSRLFTIVLLVPFLFSCHGKKDVPDVSGITVNLTTLRFEKDVFACDSANIVNEMPPLEAKYPSFGKAFFYKVLGTVPIWPADSVTRYIGGFINSYRKDIYDSVEAIFNDFSPYEKEIKEGLQFVKYYFPNYKLPENIITYIGPLDGDGDILTDNALVVGLQHYLGANFLAYQQAWVQEPYPAYISARFEPSYISINSMKNIISDIYPPKDEDTRPLIQQMIDNGKRLYILSKVQPYKEEYKLIGYTEKQLTDCYAHEAAIWNYFLQNDLLQVTDPDVAKDYISDGPKTQELGEAAPGNLGTFIGWQIVKEYMQNNSSTSLQQLINKDAGDIFEATKYKP